MGDITKSYWLDVPLITGRQDKPADGGIVVVGSGLAGVSAAYWLLEGGMTDVTIVDFEPERAATYRCAGHILYGAVESMTALVALHGVETARKIWSFSVGACEELRTTVERLGLACEYRQDGYLVIATDEAEVLEIKDSTRLLREMGFQSDFVSKERLTELGFKNVLGARFDEGSARAHPVKFRNELLRHCLARGVKYHSNVKVESIDEKGDYVEVRSSFGLSRFDAGVIAANAYSPLLSPFYRDRRLVEPFKGQIITSRPLKHQFLVKYAHSFNHGYEYALVTEDNRLLIGGWRNNVPGGEVGTYALNPKPEVERGLKDFVRDHYCISEDIEWEYSWSGIMAASSSGFPFIGPIGTRLFTCAGFTGHGFSWAHGSAKLLTDIMLGNPYPQEASYFNPRGK